jgi:proteic killer suppression protein
VSQREVGNRTESPVIRSFKCSRTEALYQDRFIPKEFQAFRDVALRKLDMLDGAAALGDLRAPPGNRLEALKGRRRGQYSIRINEQWRICFIWKEGAERVEIVDYH